MITTWRRVMKTKSLTFLLAFTFLFLFSGSVYGGDLKDGFDAVEREDYETAYKLLLPFAEQGDAGAQSNLGLMYETGNQRKGVIRSNLSTHHHFPIPSPL